MIDFVYVNGWFDQYREKLGDRYYTFKIALNWLLQHPGKNIFETGSLRTPDSWGDGYSTYLFGQFISKYGGHLWTCDIDEQVIEIAKRETKEFSEQITYVCGDSIEFLRNFDDTINLLYLDSLDCPVEGDATDAQRQNLRELQAALPKLSSQAIILLDDNNFPNGGKTLLSKDYLLENGWLCLFDLQQSLWARRPTADPSAIKEVVRQHWAGRAATFDQAPNHGLHSAEQRTAWLARLRGWAGDRPLDALDVGCGTGFLALLLAELGHRVVGVDAADEMLDLARAKAEAAGLAIDLRRSDADGLPFAEASFDLVVERHVLWTLPDPVASLREWARVLRPGGRVVLIEGDWRSGDLAATAGDYQSIKDALPLYGGRPAADLAEIVGAAGLGPPIVEPLQDPVLWGETPTRERYALLAQKPA